MSLLEAAILFLSTLGTYVIGSKISDLYFLVAFDTSRRQRLKAAQDWFHRAIIELDGPPHRVVRSHPTTLLDRADATAIVDDPLANRNARVAIESVIHATSLYHT